MKSKQYKERYLAVQEHELAVLAFADAMRAADIGFMAREDNDGGVDFTPTMDAALIRYVLACRRLVGLNEKA